jgi:hypothetical protein
MADALPDDLSAAHALIRELTSKLAEKGDRSLQAAELVCDLQV